MSACTHALGVTNGTEQSCNYTQSSMTSNSLEIPIYILACVSFMNIAVFIVGVVGNVIVIIVVARVRDMRTPTNYFLLSLSIADLLVLLICLPTALIEFYAKDRWYFGETMCKLIPLLENSVHHASVMTMFAISWERFFAICHPLRNHSISSRSTTIRMIIIIWVGANAVCVPFVFMTSLEEAEFYDGSVVHVCRTKVITPWQHGYTIGMAVVFFLLPLIILVLLYTSIIRKLLSDDLDVGTRNDLYAQHSFRSRRQIVCMLICIILLFFVSLLPMRVVSLWLVYAPVSDYEMLGFEGFLNVLSFARLMMYLSSAGNPVIYSLISTKFRCAFRKALGLASTSGGPLSSNVTFKQRFRKETGDLEVHMSLSAYMNNNLSDS